MHTMFSRSNKKKVKGHSRQKPALQHKVSSLAILYANANVATVSGGREGGK